MKRKRKTLILKESEVATLTLRRIAKLPKRNRIQVAEWLRDAARLIESPSHRGFASPHVDSFCICSLVKR